MLDCPKCGIAAYDGKSCGACRFVAGGGKVAAPPDPMHLVCEHVYQGQRCAELGSLSENLRGGGPWYCHKHFPPFLSRYSGAIVAPPQGFGSLRDALAKLDPEAILERQAIREVS